MLKRELILGGLIYNPAILVTIFAMAKWHHPYNLYKDYSELTTNSALLNLTWYLIGHRNLWRMGDGAVDVIPDDVYYAAPIFFVGICFAHQILERRNPETFTGAAWAPFMAWFLGISLAASLMIFIRSISINIHSPRHIKNIKRDIIIIFSLSLGLAAVSAYKFNDASTLKYLRREAKIMERQHSSRSLGTRQSSSHSMATSGEAGTAGLHANSNRSLGSTASSASQTQRRSSSLNRTTSVMALRRTPPHSPARRRSSIATTTATTTVSAEIKPHTEVTNTRNLLASRYTATQAATRRDGRSRALTQEEIEALRGISTQSIASNRSSRSVTQSSWKRRCFNCFRTKTIANNIRRISTRLRAQTTPNQSRDASVARGQEVVALSNKAKAISPWLPNLYRALAKKITSNHNAPAEYLNLLGWHLVNLIDIALSAGKACLILFIFYDSITNRLDSDTSKASSLPVGLIVAAGFAVLFGGFCRVDTVYLHERFNRIPLFILEGLTFTTAQYTQAFTLIDCYYHFSNNKERLFQISNTFLVVGTFYSLVMSSYPTWQSIQARRLLKAYKNEAPKDRFSMHHRASAAPTAAHSIMNPMHTHQPRLTACTSWRQLPQPSKELQSVKSWRGKPKTRPNC